MRAVLDYLTPGQRETRLRMGCDSPNAEPRYAILCPRCDGTRTAHDGSECDLCPESGALRGKVVQHRCPSSQIDADLGRAIRAYGWADRGAGFPMAGGELDQSPTFLAFSGVYAAEKARVRDEHERADKIKRENASKVKRPKKARGRRGK